MPGITFNTSNQTWRQLFGNGTTYSVPKFQRDYSWTEDQWDDLWQDIQDIMAVGSEPAHYMGYLVLQSKNSKTFEIIDGQQRLTTLSLLAIAVIRSLDGLAAAGVDSDNNRKRMEQLRNIYIGYVDPVTLVARSKLTLNRNNDGYYQDYIVPLQKLPQRRLRSSEHLLRRAFEWLNRKITESYGAAKDGAKLAQFVDDLSDRLFFTVVTVTDELNAFRVFETLNSRGVRLSPTDLLKNYLFSVVARESSHSNEIDALERRWEAMVGRLGSESFPNFLRAHWNSRSKLVRELDLFKTIRDQTRDKGAVFNLMRQMEEDVDTYAALLNPDDTLWDTGDQRRYIREMKMFSVRQPWPMLLAARRLFTAASDTSSFTQILRACSIISFRYNVIGGLATNEQERAYSGAAQQIAENKLDDAGAIIRALAPIYISDAQFRPAFEEKTLKTTAARNAQIARYILFAIESKLSGLPYDTENPKYTLEHVLPENPTGDWAGFPEIDQEEALYRLGNFTLLESGANRRVGNSGFSGKRGTYQESEFIITQRIAEENQDWTFERIRLRQKWMADQAKGIWRLSQLDGA